MSCFNYGSRNTDIKNCANFCQHCHTFKRSVFSLGRSANKFLMFVMFYKVESVQKSVLTLSPMGEGGLGVVSLPLPKKDVTRLISIESQPKKVNVVVVFVVVVVLLVLFLLFILFFLLLFLFTLLLFLFLFLLFLLKF